jgi:hypothetical protein
MQEAVLATGGRSDWGMERKSQAPGELALHLRRHHRLLWLLLGIGFALFLSSKLAQPSAISLGLFMGLLTVYHFAGQWAARLVGRWAQRSTYASPAAALFSSSAKVSALFSALSISFCLVLLIVQNSTGSLGPLPRVTGAVVLRAAVLPFLACLGAACTVSDRAWMEPSRLPLKDGPSPAARRAPSSVSHRRRPRRGVLGSDPLATNAGNQNPHHSVPSDRREGQI